MRKPRKKGFVWVKISDRLPKFNQVVTVWLNCPKTFWGASKSRAQTLWHWNNEWAIDVKGEQIMVSGENITHWQAPINEETA